MTEKSKLVGYARKSTNGTHLRISIDVKAFADAERYAANDGREFVSLVLNASKVVQIFNGDREVTSICQLVDE